MENQTAYYPPVQPAGMVQTRPQTDIAAKKKSAGKFCFISLGFFVTSILLNLSWFFTDRFKPNTYMYHIKQMALYLGTAAFIAALVFMIVARIKCRESRLYRFYSNCSYSHRRIYRDPVLFHCKGFGLSLNAQLI